MKQRNFFQGLVVVSLTVILGACAQTKTSNVHQYSSESMQKPTRVLIQDFSMDPSAVKSSSSPFAKIGDMVKGDDGKSSKDDLSKEVGDALSSELVSQFKELGFEAVRVPAGRKPGAGEIMVSGKFTNVDEGNAVRRAMVGFGAGQSSVDANVTIVAPDERPLVSMKAHADSGETPGAAVTAGVGAAAQAGTAATAAVSVAKGGAKAYQSASAHQAAEIAGKISEEFEKYAKGQGWPVKAH